MFTNKDAETLVDLSDKVPKKKRATFGGALESSVAQTEEQQDELDEIYRVPDDSEQVQNVVNYEKQNIKEGFKKTFSKLNIVKANKSKQNVIDGPTESSSVPKALSALSLEKINKSEEEESKEPKPAKSTLLSKLNLTRTSKSEEKLPNEPEGTKPETDSKKTKKKKVKSSGEKKTPKVYWVTRSIAQQIDRTLFLKHSLIDILIYLVFAVVVIGNGEYLRNTDVYLMYRGMKRQFVLQEFVSKVTGRRLTFDKIATANDVWDYLKFFTHILGTKSLYNQMSPPIVRPAIGEEKKVLLHTYVLGVPRLRQLRVRNDSCQVHPLLRNIFRTCYNVYTESTKNKYTFGPGNGTAWIYHTAAQTGSLSFTTVVGTFGGDGFYQDLHRDIRRSRKIMNVLEGNFWITRETRAIFLDFALYNGNVNTFCICKLVFIFPHLGGVMPVRSIMVSVLLPRDQRQVLMLIVFSVIMYTLTVYYLAEWIRELVYFKWKYFALFWTYMDACIIGTTLSLLYIYFAHMNIGNEILEEAKNHPDKYGNLEVHFSWYTAFRNTNALQLYLVYMKAFKYLNFNHTMGQFNNTIKKCRKDTLSFSIMFFIVFCAFTELGYLMFGENTDSFSDFPTAMFSLLCTILGDFDYEQLQKANSVMAPIFFITFIFFIFFVLINMFLAIISDSYSDVKTEIALAPSELQMSEYLKVKAVRFLKKLRLIKDTKKDKNNLVMSLEEIENILSKCGFTDEEIEGFLLKYMSLAKEKKSTVVVLKKLEDELAQQELAMGQSFQFIKPKDYFTHQEKIDQLDNSVDECTKRIEKLLNKMNRLENVKKVPKNAGPEF